MTPERKEALLDDAARRAREILAEKLDALGDRPLTVDEIEDLVEEASRDAAHWLEQRLITEQTPPATNGAACPQCGRLARYKQTLLTQLLTIHGQQPVSARYYYCQPCGQGFCPADAVLGIERGRKSTRRLRVWLAHYGAQEGSFAAVPPILADLRGLTVSESTVERTTVAVGLALAAANQAGAASAQAAVRAAAATEPEAPTGGTAPAVPAEEAAPAGEAGPPRLYLAMDGTMCPLRERWRKDGSLGKLATRYGEAKVGMAFITGRKDGLDTGILRKGCVATLGNSVGFTLLMVWLARRWGADQARELRVLGDGAAWIWKLARRFFPQAVQILDYWHVIERLFTVAEARFGSKTSAEAQSWVTAMRGLLEEDLVDLVVANIERWQPRLLKHRKFRDAQATFLHNNRDRLQYGTFLAKGYMLGSGPIEARCKQVVQSRVHEAGMHWREHTAEAVLAIRAFLHGTEAGDLRAYA